MALSLLVIQVVALFSMSNSLNATAVNTTNLAQLARGNSTGGNLIEHRGNNKPLLLSTLPVIRNNNETNSSSIWNLAHYAISPTDHHDHFSGSSAILVITIFVGFTLTGLFLLWRRHRYANREVICHYTTLNQEVTLSANDIPDANGDQEFHLDLSDDTADTSTSDDEELLR